MAAARAIRNTKTTTFNANALANASLIDNQLLPSIREKRDHRLALIGDLSSRVMNPE